MQFWNDAKVGMFYFQLLERVYIGFSVNDMQGEHLVRAEVGVNLGESGFLWLGFQRPDSSLCGR